MDGGIPKEREGDGAGSRASPSFLLPAPNNGGREPRHRRSPGRPKGGGRRNGAVAADDDTAMTLDSREESSRCGGYLDRMARWSLHRLRISAWLLPTTSCRRRRGRISSAVLLGVLVFTSLAMDDPAAGLVGFGVPLPWSRQYEENDVRIVLSMTTIPSRISSIKPTLDSLLRRQSMRFDVLYLSLPRRRWRTPNVTNDGYDVLPPFVRRYERGGVLRVLRPEYDYGPVDKLIHTLELESSKSLGKELRPRGCRIIYLDDDVVYHRDLVRNLFLKGEEYPHSAVAFNGAKMRSNFRQMGHTDPDLDRHPWMFFRTSGTVTFESGRRDDGGGGDMPVDVLQGFAGVLVRPHFFDVAELLDLVRSPDLPPAVVKSDDFIISAHLEHRGVRRTLVAGGTLPRLNWEAAETDKLSTDMHFNMMESALYLQGELGIWTEYEFLDVQALPGELWDMIECEAGPNLDLCPADIAVGPKRHEKEQITKRIDVALLRLREREQARDDAQLMKMGKKTAKTVLRPRIVLSMTTTPTRMPHIAPTLDSLVRGQTMRFDALYVSLLPRDVSLQPRWTDAPGVMDSHYSTPRPNPHDDVLPPFVRDYEREGVLRVLRPDLDHGTAGGLIHALRTECGRSPSNSGCCGGGNSEASPASAASSSCLFIYLEDGFVYDWNTVRDLVLHSNDHPDDALGFSGERLRNRLGREGGDNAISAPLNHNEEDDADDASVVVDIVHGFAGVLVRPSFFDVDAFEGLLLADGLPEALLPEGGDDLLISGYLELRNITRRVIPGGIEPEINHDMAAAAAAGGAGRFGPPPAVAGNSRADSMAPALMYLQKKLGVWDGV